MRDIENDRIANKNTLVVKFGLKWAKQYQGVLMVFSVIIVWFFLILLRLNEMLVLPFFLFAASLIQKINKVDKSSDFDPFLKKVALFFFFLSIGIGFVLYIK